MSAIPHFTCLLHQTSSFSSLPSLKARKRARKSVQGTYLQYLLKALQQVLKVGSLYTCVIQSWRASGPPYRPQRAPTRVRPVGGRTSFHWPKTVESAWGGNFCGSTARQLDALSRAAKQQRQRQEWMRTSGASLATCQQTLCTANSGSLSRSSSGPVQDRSRPGLSEETGRDQCS